jgi:hypothetical protein
MQLRWLTRITFSVGLAVIFLYGIAQAFTGQIHSDSATNSQLSQSPVSTPRSAKVTPQTGAQQSPLPLPTLTWHVPRGNVPPTPTPYWPPSMPTGLTPRAYLPLIANNNPFELKYGPRGTAGFDSFGVIKPDVWYYWNSTLPDSLDPSLARMVKCLTPAWYYSPTKISEITQAAQADFQHNIRNRVWLMMNEPDTPGYYAECGVPTWNVSNSVVSTTYYYKLVYALIKSYDPYAKVYAGGITYLNSQSTRNWWGTFLSTLANSNDLAKVEGVHVHAYPLASWSCLSLDCRRQTAQILNDWYQTQHINKGLGDRPIWITEIGGIGYCSLYPKWSANGLATVLDYVMKPMAWWFNNDPNWTAAFPDVPANPGYDSMEWFVPYSGSPAEENLWWCTFLETSTATSRLTTLGDFWRNYNFTPAQ